MSEFKVNEIAIIAWSDDGVGVNDEVEIETELFKREGELVHKVRFADKCVGFFPPKHLRKKKPPLGRWEDIEVVIGWNPVKELETNRSEL
ncbi:MAG: hypothetical protein ABUJ92_00250 [Desulfobacterales bacterium]